MEHKALGEKIEENPYGYAVKTVSAPSGHMNLIGIAGEDADSFTPGREYGEYDFNFNPTVTVNFKGKDTNVTVFCEGLSKDIELSSLEQLEKRWFFQKSPVPHCLGYILQMGKFDERDLGALLDSNFLFTVKVENVDRYMMIRVLNGDDKSVPDSTFNAIGKWIGSVSNATINEAVGGSKEKALNSVCQSVGFSYSNPDQKTLHQQHQFFAEARWGSLKKFQASKLDPLTTKDPLDNTVAHLAIFNMHLDVFPYIATKFPALLTAQNVFGNTPLHNLSLLRQRQSNAQYFEWKFMLSLPWNWTLKNKKGQTAVEKLCEISGGELVRAFDALFNHKEAWQGVAKCHDMSKLLSAALVKYLMTFEETEEHLVMQNAKVFIERGASVKGAVFDSALKRLQVELAMHLLKLGAEVTYESVVAAFGTHHRPTVDIVLQRFDLKKLSQEQSKVLCDTAVDASWSDVLQMLANSGCIIPLQVNNRGKTTLQVANIIARMHSKTVLPLKYLGVDAIDESVEPAKREKLLQTLPEELRDMFHEKETWRWTLFLEDEEKRNRYLQLYSAIARGQRETDNVKELQIRIGEVEFSVATVWILLLGRTPRQIGYEFWAGKDKPEESQNLIYKITEDDDTFNPKKSMKPRVSRQQEKNPQILEQILQSIGWPLEDKCIFLTICLHGFLYKSTAEEGKAPVKKDHHKVRSFFYPSLLTAHRIKPAKWYIKFVQNVYGVEAAGWMREMTDSNSESDTESSGSGSE